MHHRTVAFTSASVPYPHTLLLSLTAEFSIYFFKVLSPNENFVVLFFLLQEDGRWWNKEKSTCPSRMCFQNCNLVKFFPLEYRSLSLITCCSSFTMITFSFPLPVSWRDLSQILTMRIWWNSQRENSHKIGLPLK